MFDHFVSLLNGLSELHAIDLQEMLDKWRPLLCPNTDAVYDAIYYFALFLPTYNVLEYKDQG